MSREAYLNTLKQEGVNLDRLLDSYNHNPKNQNPLYLTTQNEFGFKKPTTATYTYERIARDQKFSNRYEN